MSGAQATAEGCSEHSPEVAKAFFAAVASGDIATLRQLIASGAVTDVNTITNELGQSPLRRVGDAATAEFLVRECNASVSAHVNADDTDAAVSDPPLLEAAQYGHGVDVVRVLLDNGADVNGRARDDTTALHAAYSSASVVRLLLSRGANVNARDFAEKTPLFTAARYGSIEAMEELIEAGADVNTTDTFGRTAMFEICGSIDFMTKSAVLVKHGASMHVVGRNMETLMHEAAFEGRVETLEYLASHGVPVDSSTLQQRTPLYNAAARGRATGKVLFLLDRGASVHGDPSLQKLPLHAAVLYGHLRVAAELLARGAFFHPSQPICKPADTPATLLSDVEVLDLLIQHCAAVVPQDFASKKYAYKGWLIAVDRLKRFVSCLKPFYEPVVRTLDDFLAYALNWHVTSHDRWVAYMTVNIRLWKWMLEHAAQWEALGPLERREPGFVPPEHNPRTLIPIVSLREEVDSYPAFRRRDISVSDKDAIEKLEKEALAYMSLLLRTGYQLVKAYVVDEIQQANEVCKSVSSQTAQRSLWRKLYLAARALTALHEHYHIHGKLASSRSDARDPGAVSPHSAERDQQAPAAQTDDCHTSVRWQSPESLQGTSETCASDVYSFGMCVLEAVSGQVPWGKVSSGVVRVFASIGRLPAKPERMSGEQWQLVESMCVKDPTQRPKMAVVAHEMLGLIVKDAVETVEAQ